MMPTLSSIAVVSRISTHPDRVSDRGPSHWGVGASRRRQVGHVEKNHCSSHSVQLDDHL